MNERRGRALGPAPPPLPAAMALLRPAPDAAPFVGAAPAMTIRQVVRRFWPDLRPLRWWLLLMVALLAAAPLIAVLEVVLFQKLVDDVLVPATLEPLGGSPRCTSG